MQPTYNIDNPNLSYQTKLDLWETGFGLQKVDGLTPSDYMIELSRKQASGQMSYQEVEVDITRYHQEVSAEANLVALKIAELLSRCNVT